MEIMNIIKCILFFVLGMGVPFLVMEVISVFLIGFYISKSQQEKYMNLNHIIHYDINPRDNEILSLYNYSPGMYISYTGFSVVSKYYINREGIVPRWSKLHKKIEEYYRIAKQEEKNIKEGYSVSDSEEFNVTSK